MSTHEIQLTDFGTSVLKLPRVVSDMELDTYFKNWKFKQIEESIFETTKAIADERGTAKAANAAAQAEIKTHREVIKRALCQIHRVLTQQGKRNDLCPDAPKGTWQWWCEQNRKRLGFSLRTANRIVWGTKPKPKDKGAIELKEGTVVAMKVWMMDYGDPHDADPNKQAKEVHRLMKFKVETIPAEDGFFRTSLPEDKGKRFLQPTLVLIDDGARKPKSKTYTKKVERLKRLKEAMDTHGECAAKTHAISFAGESGDNYTYCGRSINKKGQDCITKKVVPLAGDGVTPTCKVCAIHPDRLAKLTKEEEVTVN